jgi:hypothetical protein
MGRRLDALRYAVDRYGQRRPAEVFGRKPSYKERRKFNAIVVGVVEKQRVWELRGRVTSKLEVKCDWS